MPEKQPLIIQALRLLNQQGPLSPEKIRQKLGLKKRTTVHPLLSILRTLGLCDYYVDQRGEKWVGVYVITPYGKQCPKLKETTRQ